MVYYERCSEWLLESLERHRTSLDLHKYIDPYQNLLVDYKSKAMDTTHL